jgi:hypothetical protein
VRFLQQPSTQTTKPSFDDLDHQSATLNAAWAHPSTSSLQIKWLRNTYGTDSVRS